jgi:RNA polymerase sigma-70 factor (ECF subfamily)
MKETADSKVIDLEAFHAGDRRVLAEVYHRHLGRVSRSVSRYCRGADAECVIHDLFLALLERRDMRESFRGGDLGAWLATLAGRRALDHLRRRTRLTLLDDPRSLEGKLEPVEEEQGLLHRDQVRRLERALDRFAEEVLPKLTPKLVEVFRARYREPYRSQIEAAAELGIPRTTLIDRETRLMRYLGRFLRRHLREVER